MPLQGDEAAIVICHILYLRGCADDIFPLLDPPGHDQQAPVNILHILFGF